MKKNSAIGMIWSFGITCLILSAFHQGMGRTALAVDDELGLGVPASYSLAQDNAAPAAPVVQPDLAPVSQTPPPVAEIAPPAVEVVDAPVVTAEVSQIPPEGAEVFVGTAMGGASTTNTKVSISLDQVPLMDVLRMFTRISGANIVTGTNNLQQTVTVSIQDVEWQDALTVILDSAGLAMVQAKGNIYTIVSKGELATAPLDTSTYKLKFLTTSEMLPVVQKLIVSPGGSVSAAPGNVLVIKETMDRLLMITKTMDEIDKPRPQAFIEAKFVELNNNAIKRLGVNWQSLGAYTLGSQGALTWRLTDTRDRTQNRSDSLGLTDTRAHSDTVSKDQSFDERKLDSGRFENVTPVSTTHTIQDTINRGQDVAHNESDTFTKTLNDVRAAVLSADEFRVTLSALKQDSDISILSNPKVVVLSGEEASINVGNEIPNVRALPQGDSGDRYAYELSGYIQSGINVKVTPIVHTDDNINLRITPEIRRRDEADDVEAGGTKFFAFTTSKVNTQFNVRNNNTVAIGGLIRNEDTDIVTKVPILGDIPVIGTYLFRHTTKGKSQAEIVIFVTVGVITAEDMEANSGVPSEALLIHRDIARRALETEEAMAAAEKKVPKDKTSEEKKQKGAEKRKAFKAEEHQRLQQELLRYEEMLKEMNK